VAGVRERIVKIGNTAVPASYIEFGASRHMASAIIGYMRVNPPIRSVINIRFNDELVKICKNLFSVSSYDRSKEPTGIKKKEGSSVACCYIGGALK
jgi:hydroxymethylpyrimidine kinase / phosphomethylpyrimidine kinase / thiamine-phosphate diphosphorylase